MLITLKDYFAVTQFSRTYRNEDGYGGFRITKSGITECFDNEEINEILEKYGNDFISNTSIYIERSSLNTYSLGVYISLD